MQEWLVAITNGAVLVIDAMVLVIIAIGTIQAFIQGLRVMLLPAPRDRRSDSNFAQFLPRERSLRGSQPTLQGSF
jgi:hypothetical protein